MINQLRALADETRLRIFSILLHGDLCVCEIETYLRLTQSNASKHLRVLRDTEVIVSYKKSQWVYYKISEEFKKNHQALYDYVVQNVKTLSTYNKDENTYESYRGVNLCKCITNVGGNNNEKE